MGLFSKKYLGVDIGSSGIKVAMISLAGNKKRLENYADFQLPASNNLQTFNDESLLLISENAALILQAILKKAKIKERKASFSIPDFSTFFTTFVLPPMTENEVPQAVEFEARHHIPLPLSEVTFDWQVIGREEAAGNVKLKILLVAVPNSVLKNYQRMAQIAQIEIAGIEAEVFSLIRSLPPLGRLELSPLLLVDIGRKSATVSVVEQRKLQQSFSFDFSSHAITKDLSVGLQVSIEEAETLKQRFGLDPIREDVSKIVLSKVETLAGEMEKIIENFFRKEGKNIQGVVLAGGACSLFGLKEYIAGRLKKDVVLAQPFLAIESPVALSKRLKEIGPSFAVALGAAMMSSS